MNLGKLLDIEIELHYSWFFVIILLTYALSTGFFPHYFPDLTMLENWTVSLISAVLLFASVLVHELSHSAVAKKYRIGVKRITLFFFGGIAQISPKKLKPKPEFLMAIAGPIVSLCLSALFYFMYTLSIFVTFQAITYYLSQVNLILALFNLVPGYPLDGGRALRAVLWMYYGDIHKATRIASYGGEFFATFLIILGVLSVFAGGMGGFWFIFLGLFLYFIAKMGYEQLVLREVLEHISVKELVTHAKTVSPSLSLDKFFERYVMKSTDEHYPVVYKKTYGLVGLRQLSAVEKKRWPKLKVKDIMVNLPNVPKVKIKDNAYKVFMAMVKKRAEFAVVFKDNRGDKANKFCGFITMRDILKKFQLRLRKYELKRYER